MTRLAPSVRSGVWAREGDRIERGTRHEAGGDPQREIAGTGARHGTRLAVERTAGAAVRVGRDDGDAGHAIAEREGLAVAQGIDVQVDLEVLDGRGGVQQHVALGMDHRPQDKVGADRIGGEGARLELLRMDRGRSGQQRQQRGGADEPGWTGD